MPVTLLKFPSQKIIKIKTQEKDGYQALVLGVLKNGTFSDNMKVEDYDLVTEFPILQLDWQFTTEGNVLTSELFQEWVMVAVTWIWKWKGFQWWMKRFHLRWWPETHGSKFHRHIGSMGNRKPRRTQKWHPHAWRMWWETVTLKNIMVHDIFDHNGSTYVALHGSIPGANQGFVKIYL